MQNKNMKKHEKNMKRDSVSAYIHTHKAWCLLYASVNILNDQLPFPYLRTYLMDGLFLNQKTYDISNHSNIVFTEI